MEPQISIGSGLTENEKWNEYCHRIMKISHRFSLITALCLLAGISRAQSWLPQALPGESAFRLLECDYREARLETCLSVLPASASFLVGIERLQCGYAGNRVAGPEEGHRDDLAG